MMCVYTYIHMYIVYIHEVVVSGTHFFIFAERLIYLLTTPHGLTLERYGMLLRHT